jgi:hypothetical protein
MPLEKALSEKSWIVSWARIPGLSPEKVLNMKISEWILPWFKSNDFKNKLIIITNSISIVILIIMLFKKDFKYAKIQFIIILNLIFWFFMAPDPRFAYGFLFTGFSLTLAYLIRIIEYSSSSKILKYINTVLVCMFLIILCGRISIPLEVLKKPSLLVVSAPFDKVVTTGLKSDFNYRIPAQKGEDRCYYCDIPCVPFPLNNVKLRGNDLQKGFKVINENH